MYACFVIYLLISVHVYLFNLTKCQIYLKVIFVCSDKNYVAVMFNLLDTL